MRDEPAGFWTFFFAVLAALVAHDLVRLAVTAAGLSIAFASFGNKVTSATTPGHLPARPHRSSSEPLPVWPGPITAYRERSSRACIAGVVADYVDNGWVEQRDQKCTAGSP